MMKRVAAPMLGGVGTALLMVLIVFPAIFAFWRGQDINSGAMPTLKPIDNRF